jgi:hypothetical protein
MSALIGSIACREVNVARAKHGLSCLLRLQWTSLISSRRCIQLHTHTQQRAISVSTFGCILRSVIPVRRRDRSLLTLRAETELLLRPTPCDLVRPLIIARIPTLSTSVAGPLHNIYRLALVATSYNTSNSTVIQPSSPFISIPNINPNTRAT